MLSLALTLCLGSLTCDGPGSPLSPGAAHASRSQVGTRRLEGMPSQDALKLFRNPKGEDAEFVGELFGLVREVRVLIALAEATTPILDWNSRIMRQPRTTSGRRPSNNHSSGLSSTSFVEKWILEVTWRSR